ncbi:MAG: hypothetical protein IJ174_10015, partial [Clostridia bacterium]|nr:hypothetical protein [Clostridia bacterium]
IKELESLGLDIRVLDAAKNEIEIKELDDEDDDTSTASSREVLPVEEHEEDLEVAGGIEQNAEDLSNLDLEEEIGFDDLDDLDGFDNLDLGDPLDDDIE